jgi:hypothetical protein
VSGGGDVTIGYEYYAGIHMIACHGPVDKLSRIIVGEREAWSGSQTTTGQIFVDARELFGGKKREGGVEGYVDVLLGESAQAQNAYLASKLGANTPAFRGLFSLVLNQCLVSMMNPYIKPWKPEVTRWPKGWYEAKKAIGNDANPAHIIVECLTNADWGLGYQQSDINLVAFQAAADALYTEGFGLSLLWDRQAKIEDFIKEILRHIDAALYVDPATGLFTLRLIRNDVIPSSLPLFTPDEIVNVDSFERATPADMPNTLSVRYVDREGQTQAVTVHDIGMLETTGQAISTNIDMPGIPTKELALKVAMRELGQVARPLAKVTVTLTRKASGLRIGDAVRLTSPEHGLNQQVMRVMGIGYGTLRDGVIRAELIEDAFSLPAYTFTAGQDGLWESPYTQPAASSARAVIEAPYWTIIKDITGENNTDLLESEAGLLMVGAGDLAQDSLGIDVYTRQGSDNYDLEFSGTPTPSGTLQANIGPTATSITILNSNRLIDVDIGDYWAVISPGTATEEIVGITALNPTTGVATIKRGVLDTTPKSHSAGARIYFMDEGAGLSRTQYLAGEAVDVKICPRTSLGVLSQAAAATDAKTFTGRATRPYAPGNFKFNTVAYPATISGELTVSWSHRNRLTQTAYLVAQTEGNIGPEAGTTYTLKLYGQDGLLKKTETGLTGTSYTWTTEDADSGLAAGVLNTSVRAVLTSVIGGRESHQAQDWTATR